MSFDATAYNVTVRRISVDGEPMFEARVLELPDVSGFGASLTEAYDTAIEAIEALHSIAERDGESFPEPVEPEAEYSGRVTLRMPKSLHRAVALDAQQEGISINSYIVNAVSIRLGDAARLVEKVRDILLGLWPSGATTNKWATGVAVAPTWTGGVGTEVTTYSGILSTATFVENTEVDVLQHLNISASKSYGWLVQVYPQSDPSVERGRESWLSMIRAAHSRAGSSE